MPNNRFSGESFAPFAFVIANVSCVCGAGTRVGAQAGADGGARVEGRWGKCVRPEPQGTCVSWGGYARSFLNTPPAPTQRGPAGRAGAAEPGRPRAWEAGGRRGAGSLSAGGAGRGGGARRLQGGAALRSASRARGWLGERGAPRGAGGEGGVRREEKAMKCAALPRIGRRGGRRSAARL